MTFANQNFINIKRKWKCYTMSNPSLCAASSSFSRFPLVAGWHMPLVGNNQSDSKPERHTVSYKINYGDSTKSNNPNYKHRYSFYIICQKDEENEVGKPKVPVERDPLRPYRDYVDDWALYDHRVKYEDISLDCLAECYETISKLLPDAKRDLSDSDLDMIMLYDSPEYKEIYSGIPKCPPFFVDPRKNMLETLRLRSVIDILGNEAAFRYSSGSHHKNPSLGNLDPKWFDSVRFGEAKFQWYRPEYTARKDVISNGLCKFVDTELKFSHKIFELNEKLRELNDAFKDSSDGKMLQTTVSILYLSKKLTTIFLLFLGDWEIMSKPGSKCYNKKPSYIWTPRGATRYLPFIHCDRLDDAYFDLSLISSFFRACMSIIWHIYFDKGAVRKDAPLDDFIHIYKEGDYPCITVTVPGFAGWSGTVILPLYDVSKCENVGRSVDKQFKTQYLSLKSCDLITSLFWPEEEKLLEITK